MQLAVLGGSSLLSGGTLFKATMLGASIAGSMIMNGRKKPVGKLNDLRVSSSSYGRGIAKVWGTMRVTGNMFWATNFREEKVYISQKGKEKSGSKGKMKAKKGKATPVYKYYANFAMGLCEGPMDDVIRIWADNNLIYNKLNPNDKDLVGPGFSQRDEDENSGKGSMKSANGKKGSGGQSGRFAFRFYSGDDQQLPDPFMESEEGVGKVPAYRDLCYLMFQDFALEDFGNRIPTITAEVVSKAERKSMVLNFENMDPPANTWFSELIDPVMLDLVRGNLIATARDEDGDFVLRMWDMESRKETKRLRLLDLVPQACPHGQDDEFGFGFGSVERTWTETDAANFKVFGTTPKGDLVIQRTAGNYSPYLFVDPSSGQIIKSWGRSGNILTDPFDGIFVGKGAFPIIGQNDKAMPTPYTIIYSSFGEMHLFDETYNKVGTIACNGRRANHRQGAIGTKRAMFFTSTDYAGVDRFNFYYAPVDGPNHLIDEANGLGEWVPSTNSETYLGRWPAIPGSKGNILHFYDMAYIAGANCLGLLAGDDDLNVWVAKLDIITGEILWEERLDGVSFAGLNMNGFTSPGSYVNTNYWTIEGLSHLVKIDFHLETVLIQAAREGTTMPSTRGWARYYWSERDAMISFTRIDGEVTPTIVYQDRKVQKAVDLSKIVADMAEAVGIESTQIITNDLDTQEPLLGYMYEQPVDARSVLEELANVFQFDCVETDHKLLFKMRGGTPAVTIQENMLGIIESDLGENEKITETIQQELELPERVTVSYYDPKNDYETGSQYFKRPSRPLAVMSTKEHLEVTFNMSLLSNDAKSMAKRILYAAWSERTSTEFRLPRDYLLLDPSDIVQIDLNDGRSLDVRITDLTVGANLEIECAGVQNYADSYQHRATTERPGGVVTQPGTTAGFAYPVVMNIPYIEDAHQNPGSGMGYYWGAAAQKPGFNFGILQSRYEDTTWTTDGFTQLDGIWGYVKGKVPPPANGWNIEDTKTELVLVPAFDFNEHGVVYTWESLTDEEWPSTKNMVIIDDEIILFKKVVENSDGSVTISHLIRGYRGSIDAAYRHGTSSTWMVYNSGSVHEATEDLEYLLKTQTFVINTGNALSPFVVSKRFTLDGSTERPLPVGDVRRTNQANGDVLIRWSRATRLGGSLKDGTGTIPLNEENEEYYVFLLPGEYDAKTWNPEKASLYLWKSVKLTSGQVTIPKAVLETAGLSNKRDLNVVIHQMSAKVGWGFPMGAKLRYSMIGV